jgi:hypothetical protein
MGGIGINRFSLRASGGLTLPVSTLIEGTRAGAEVTLIRATLGACYRLADGVHTFFDGCAGGEVGSLRASGFRLDDARPGSAFWSAAVVEGLVGLRASTSLLLIGGLSAVVPFRELSVVAGTRPLHATSPFGGRLWIGVEIRTSEVPR